MTPVEQLLFAANRRHFHEINLAANKPAAKPLGWADCRHCSTCGKDEAVRHG